MSKTLFSGAYIKGRQMFFSPKGSPLPTALFCFCLLSLSAAFAASTAVANPRGTTRRPAASQDLPALRLQTSSGALSFEARMSTSTSIPFASSCPRSEAQNGSLLTSGLGSNQAESITVEQEEGATLSGSLRGAGGGGVAGALICVYSNVVTDEESELLGVAVTGEDGGYEFAVPPGPSRSLTAVYRTDQGQLSAWTLLQTRVTPVLQLSSDIVHNKHVAHFSGEIPGPHNDGIVVVLQVKRGKGWLTFRRYDTRGGGKFALRYCFTRTFTPTVYIMRAQVLGAPGYPYLGGNSRPLALRVLP